MGKTVTEEQIRDVLDEFYYAANCGSEVRFTYNGVVYDSDIGYALDGVFMIMDALERKLGLNLTGDKMREQRQNIVAKVGDTVYIVYPHAKENGVITGLCSYCNNRVLSSDGHCQHCGSKLSIDPL